MKVLYTAEATATGGRDGTVSTSDGVLNLALGLPKELGGSGGDLPNPEQLFACGYAACFHSALKGIARAKKIDVSASSVTARVGIGQNDAGGFGLEVTIEVSLPGIDDAEGLVAAAHVVCPYSNATRGNIPVDLKVAAGAA
jgi:lipoyl-dependent peroxiredoxin